MVNPKSKCVFLERMKMEYLSPLACKKKHGDRTEFAIGKTNPSRVTQLQIYARRKGFIKRPART
jgi:hypothetical protein